MKYCPNPACAYAVKRGRPLEYRDDIVVCVDCGFLLDEVAVVAPSLAASAVARPAESDLTARLAVTAIAMVVMLVGMNTPVMPAASSVMGEGGSFPQPPLLPLGVTTFVLGFQLAELVALMIPSLRSRRVGDANERAPIDRAGFAIGAVATVIQCLALARAESADALGLNLPSQTQLFAQYVLAHFAMFGLAVWVTKRGVLNGLALATFLSLGAEPLGDAMKLVRALGADTIDVSMVLWALLPVFVVVALTTLASRRSRPLGGLGPTAAPFPVSGLLATVVVSTVYAMLAIVPGLQDVLRFMQSSPLIYLGFSAFLAADLQVVFGLLFFRPTAIATIWSRWVPGIDHSGVILKARALLPVALLSAVAAQVIPYFGWNWVGSNEGFRSIGLRLSLAPLVLMTLIALDFIDELQARLRLGTLVSIRPLHRLVEVEPVEYVLGTAGIPVVMRSMAYRATLQFFGSYAPIEVLVPASRADDARQVLGVS